jgi:hypothetical protein
MRGSFEFAAAEMASPLSGALCVNVGDRCSDARQVLASHRYDQAPVLDEQRVVGWVRAAQLGGRGFVSSALVSLDRCVVLGQSSPVADVISLVADKGLIFLAGSTGISEFVVPSDLDRHVVRAYLYVLLSEIESRLANLVRDDVAEEDVIATLDKPQRKRYESARSRGQETHAVEYLYLSSYQKLIANVFKLSQLSSWPPADQLQDLRSLNPLRNCIAHPSKSLTGELDPATIAELTRRANAVLDELEKL